MSASESLTDFQRRVNREAYSHAANALETTNVRDVEDVRDALAAAYREGYSAGLTEARREIQRELGDHGLVS